MKQREHLSQSNSKANLFGYLKNFGYTVAIAALISGCSCHRSSPDMEERGEDYDAAQQELIDAKTNLEDAQERMERAVKDEEDKKKDLKEASEKL